MNIFLLPGCTPRAENFHLVRHDDAAWLFGELCFEEFLGLAAELYGPCEVCSVFKIFRISGS